MPSAQAPGPRHQQLQSLYLQLLARIEAAEKDITRALSEHERQIHRERLDELAADRRAIDAYLDAFEQNQPASVPWPPELRTADLAASLRSPAFIVEPVRPSRAPFHVPDSLPPNYVPRRELLAEVRQAVLADADSIAPSSAIRMNALYGMGGIGKTVLTRALCDDPAVWAAFPDGILWARVGQTPDLTSRLREWIDALGGPISETAPTLERLKSILAGLLQERACLLIADDVWKKAHAEAFRVGGPKCLLLLTTRDAAVAEELGADVHPIPIMAEAEALALLEAWAGDGLRDASPDLKTDIVRRLGRLPLAIKLAGAQLQRKDPGQWLANFDARKLQMRRVEEVHDSLAATFDLSLDDLDPDARRLYVALAIFKEDEPAPAVAIYRLWFALGNLDAEQSSDLLDDLAARALLQRSQEPGDDIIVHDLLRDFMAAELEEEGAINAHRILLEAYRRTQESDGWHTAPDDGYLYDHLTYHLAQLADRDTLAESSLHSLFLDQRWLHRRVVQSGYLYDGYLVDLALALNRDCGSTRSETGPSPIALADCLRYGLIRASINSLAARYEPSLLARAVDLGEWPAERGLSVASRIPDAHQRARALIALLEMKGLSSGQRQRATQLSLAAAADIAGERERAAELAALAPYLEPDGLALQALDAANYIRADWLRCHAVAALAPRLPADVAQQALRSEVGAAQRNSQEQVRAAMLEALAPRLTRELARQGLAVALGINAEMYRAQALAALAPLLTEELAQEGLAAARAIGWPWHRVQVLAILARGAGSPLREQVVDEMVSAVSGIDWPELRARALLLLIPLLASHEREARVKTAREVALALEPKPRTEILARLVPYLSGEDRGKSVQEGLRLSSFAATPAERAQRAEALRVLLDAIPAAERNDAVRALLDHMAEAMGARAAQEPLAATSDEDLQASLLVALAPDLTGEALQEAFQAALAMIDHDNRSQVLAALAPHLAWETIAGHVSSPQAAKVQQHLVAAMAVLAPYLPEGDRGRLVEDGLTAALTITDEAGRTEALVAMAPLLRGQQVAQAMENALTVTYVGNRAKVLRALAPNLAPLWRKRALHEARSIRNEAYRAEVLLALAPHVTGELAEECYQDAESLVSAVFRAQVLTALLLRLSSSTLYRKALEGATAAIREQNHVPSKIQAIAHLAPHLPEEARNDWLQSAQVAAKGLRPLYKDSVDALAALAGALPEDERRVLMKGPLDLIQRRGTDEQKREALVAWTPVLAGELLAAGQAAAAAITDHRQRAEALAALMEVLPNPDQSVFQVRQAIADHLCARLALGSREALLAFVAESRLFRPPILTPEAITACARHITEICQEWEWL